MQIVWLLWPAGAARCVVEGVDEMQVLGCFFLVIKQRRQMMPPGD